MFGLTRLPLFALVLCVACGPAEEEVEVPTGTPDGTEPSVEALRATVEHSSALADSIEAILRPVPLMRPSDVSALRRYLNDAHVARARELGVHVRSSAQIDSLVEAGALVSLEDSTRYWVLRYPGSQDYVVPHARELLEELGRRFQGRLEEMGLPPYRIEITSVLRTAAQQDRLRRRNPNAAAGTSSHEFGTTVDIAYSVYPSWERSCGRRRRRVWSASSTSGSSPSTTSRWPHLWHSKRPTRPVPSLRLHWKSARCRPTSHSIHKPASCRDLMSATYQPRYPSRSCC